MPRKQRFKPSRKPKAIGTQTDLAPVEDAGATMSPSDSMYAPQTHPSDYPAGDRGDPDARTPAMDAGEPS